MPIVSANYQLFGDFNSEFDRGNYFLLLGMDPHTNKREPYVY